jgi:hypothetical protein
MNPTMTSNTINEPLSEKELCPEDLLAGQEAAFARDIKKLQSRRNEFVEISCPACFQTFSQHAFEKYGFSFRACQVCKTIYAAIPDSPGRLFCKFRELLLLGYIYCSCV